ncbi:MAG: hypothetical protein K5765_03260 [Clostridia bacterium]|nr:hypothetical protein [Clostridia bacterium]
MSNIEDIKRRLFSVIPTSSIHMMEFLKLMDIRFVEDETKSAAITCSIRPELLLNKTFVDTYCKTDEHLFMLIMHELYHIVLGHTHLFKRHSEIDNIAFDAVINAILCRMFPEEEYISFFKSLNGDNLFPGCILRPIGNNTPQKFIPTLKNLYLTNTGTYFEVYECITNELEEFLKTKGGSYILLGDHYDDNDDMNNPLLKKMLDKVISDLPGNNLISNGRKLGGELENKTINFAKAERVAQNKMNRLLLKSGVVQGNISKRKIAIKHVLEDATLVTPDYKDRMLLAKSIIYGQPLLYNSSLINSRIVRDNNVQTLVYLDVSGSVIDDINHFAPLLLQPYKNKECLLFAFSTVVVPVSYKNFRKGNYQTTGGTDIDCIFEHYFSLPKNKQTKKILILTDGCTGTVSDDYYQRIKQQKIEVYCGLFGDYTKEDMSNITKYFEEF